MLCLNPVQGAACAGAGFRVIRVSATSYWPDIMKKSYFGDEAGWWALFDTFVGDAKSAGCSLVLSLFWNPFNFPDALGEPMGRAVDMSAPSVTRTAMVAFATSIATRYANEPAVAAWEFGNEWNLNADLNQTRQQPAIAPGRGTPPARTNADNFTMSGYTQLASQVVAAIRAVDTLQRPVSSGNAIPRPDATWLTQSYTQPDLPLFFDTQTQFIAAAAAESGYADWVSMHFYAGSDMARWGLTDPNSPDGVMAAAAKAVAAMGPSKSLFIGEFGDPTPVGNRPFTHAVLAAMGKYGVDKGMVWVWEFYQQGPTEPAAQFSLLPSRDAVTIADMQAWNRAAAEEE